MLYAETPSETPAWKRPTGHRANLKAATWAFRCFLYRMPNNYRRTAAVVKRLLGEHNTLNPLLPLLPFGTTDMNSRQSLVPSKVAYTTISDASDATENAILYKVVARAKRPRFRFCVKIIKSGARRPAATSYYKHELPISTHHNWRVLRRDRFGFGRRIPPSSRPILFTTKGSVRK